MVDTATKRPSKARRWKPKTRKFVLWPRELHHEFGYILSKNKMGQSFLPRITFVRIKSSCKDNLSRGHLDIIM